ncbi:MAG: hypothetical protein KF861_06580 [Planctomycetaceae bacterium]|nr:hypothetical protein [Planctomycetaceae bacterium]
MKVHQFLDHFGITENPFAQEDAQSDHVFLQHCLQRTHHPAWDKIYGNPHAPSTSVVFGEQGSGKTALRLQMVEQLRQHNAEHPSQRAFIIEYDDFNSFLDAFRERLHGRQRKQDKALKNWRLWDHMDAILTLATTKLANSIRDPNSVDPSQAVRPADLAQLSRLQQRDILLLAAFYDHNRDLAHRTGWHVLRRKLGFRTWSTWRDLLIGLVVTAVTVGLVLWLSEWRTLLEWWVAAILLAGWTPWLFRQARLMWRGWQIRRQLRVFDHHSNTLRKILLNFNSSEIVGQPMPALFRSDDRYGLLMKLQSVLQSLGFTSLVVMVDRLDEPHLINGSAERIRDLLWPMFDNKFLKHPGIAFKMLLPASVAHYLDRQDKEFYDRSRLDKQNLIPSLEWSGEALYDIANDRVRACAKLADTPPTVQDLFDTSISREELISIYSRLRAPRHLFKFMHRLLVDHCSKYTEDQPSWKISRETLHTSLALFLKDLSAYDQGRGTG